MTAKILVTGATGNTGSGLVGALRSQNIDVRALVRDEGKAQALKDQGAEIYVGDLTKPDSLAGALEGIDKATFDTLRPHIAALPGRTAINVNTATGPVLQSLDEELTGGDVESLMSERQESGFADIDNAFAQWPELTGLITDSSDFFQLKVIVRVDTVRITHFSLLERGPQGDVTPILRSLGTT